MTELVQNEDDERRNLSNSIEKYVSIKVRVLQDKIEEVRGEIESIKNAKNPEFLAKSKTLEDNKQLKLWQAEQTREAKLKQVEDAFQNELKLAEEDYRIDKGALRDAWMQSTLESLKKVQDEKVHIVSKFNKNPTLKLNEMTSLSSYSSTPTPATVTERITRARKKRDYSDEVMPYTKKKYGTTGPAIVWALKASDIEEDLKIVKKSYSNGKKHSV